MSSYKYNRHKKFYFLYLFFSEKFLSIEQKNLEIKKIKLDFPYDRDNFDF